MNQNVKRTILRDLSCPTFQQETDPSSSRLDEFYRSGVCHVPCALPIDFDDLISYLLIKETLIEPRMDPLKLHFQQFRKASFRGPVSRGHLNTLVVPCCFIEVANSSLHPESDQQT